MKIDEEALKTFIRDNLKVRVREGRNDYYDPNSKSVSVELFLEGDEHPFSTDSFSFTEGEPHRGY